MSSPRAEPAPLDRCPAPLGFRPLVGEVQWARFTTRGPIFAVMRQRAAAAGQGHATAAQAAGTRYEQRAQGYLLARYSPELGGALYAPGMWIQYGAKGRTAYAQPDGLLVDFERGLITIMEIKLKHTQAAWWGLRQLYEPLIRHIFGHSWHYAVCELVRWYEPLPWPEPFSILPHPEQLGVNEFGIHIWRDRDWEWGHAVDPTSPLTTGRSAQPRLSARA